MANTAQNVNVGKPAASGAIYVAPIGTAVPLTVSATLSDAFVCLGYVSEDGLTNSNSAESDEIRAWGSEVVYTAQTSKSDTFQFVLIEGKNMDVLKVVYGPDNVSQDADGGIAIKSNSQELSDHVWVIEMVNRGDTPKRVVVPRGKVSEVGDILYTDDEVVGYDLTVTASLDEDGNTHYEFTQGSGWVDVFWDILVFYDYASVSGDTLTITGEASVNDETLVLTN